MSTLNSTQFRMPTGLIVPYAGLTSPSGFLLCDGSTVSRATYSDLFETVNPVVGTFTVTIASPGVFTMSSHGFKQGDAIYFTTTGSLPTGLSQETVYYVNVVSSNTFNVSTSPHTIGMFHVNTSGSQSGTHTLRRSPYGTGDKSTTFNVPDLRGRVVAGLDSMGGTAANNLTGQSGLTEDALGAVGGLDRHTLATSEMPSHRHGMAHREPSYKVLGGGGGAVAYLEQGHGVNVQTQSSGSDNPHNNMQPTMVLNYLIAT